MFQLLQLVQCSMNYPFVFCAMLMTVTDVLISIEEAEEKGGFSGLKKNPCAAQTLADDVSFLLKVFTPSEVSFCFSKDELLFFDSL